MATKITKRKQSIDHLKTLVLLLSCLSCFLWLPRRLRQRGGLAAVASGGGVEHGVVDVCCTKRTEPSTLAMFTPAGWLLRNVASRMLSPFIDCALNGPRVVKTVASG